MGATGDLKTASINIGSAHILYGDLLSVFIDFIVVALVVYFGVKIIGLDKLDKKKDYIIYCHSGVRGGYFMNKMRDSGFHRAYNILGGFVGWKVSKLPLTNEV